MADAPLVIDVVDPRLFARSADDDELVVVVEPLYGAVAVAAALDAGWESVEVALELDGDAPIPLVSFEQSPPANASARRCRVRSDDLLAACVAGGVLGAPTLARPLCAQIAARDMHRVTFLAAPSDGALAIDAWWGSGMLVRVLLDELDRGSQLTDAAGMAVTLATGAEDVRSQLAAGARWQRHLARGGAADDLRVAAAVDSLAIVPVLAVEDGVVIARPWSTSA